MRRAGDASGGPGRPALALVAIGALALGARLAYGAGFDSYDPLWSLVWGREIARGDVPDLTAAAIAPTPHPLANIVGAGASLFGQGGPTVLRVISFLSLAALVWAGYRLGRALFGVAVGAGFAFLLATRPPLVSETLGALLDVPFLALVFWAAALEAERPRRGLPMLALLGLAGLLRPEAWLLSGAYALYLCVGAPAPEMWRWLGAAAAAPLVWMAFDLIATGDPFHSLHGTQDLASLLGRPKGAGTALASLPAYLEFMLPEPLLWAGLAGVMFGLGLLYPQSLLPAAMLGLGLVSFVALGVAGLPLLYRYVFVPALVLALFAAVALLGWVALPVGRQRRIWTLAAAPAAALVAAFWVPGDLDRLDETTADASRVTDKQRSMRAAIAPARTRGLVRRCLPIHVPSPLDLPVLAYRLDVPPSSITSGRLPSAGSVLAPSERPPPGRAFRRRGGSDGWIVYSSCPATPSSSSSSSPP